jgi:predicted transcriptional regulator
MLKTPCEYMQWQGLPIIRKELVKSLINNYGFNQKETAEILGVTPAAVSQYLHKKRGKINIINNEILEEINISAERIKNRGPSIVISEICRICCILKKHNVVLYNIIK